MKTLKNRFIVERGGALIEAAPSCRVALRFDGRPGIRDFTRGFRLALRPTIKSEK